MRLDAHPYGNLPTKSRSTTHRDDRQWVPAGLTLPLKALPFSSGKPLRTQTAEACEQHPEWPRRARASLFGREKVPSRIHAGSGYWSQDSLEIALAMPERASAVSVR